MRQPIDRLLEPLIDCYAAARDQLQAHPQFPEYATIKDIPPDLKTLVEQYQTARQDLLRENIPVESIVPARALHIGDCIRLENIVCVDADGVEFERYDQLYVRRDIFCYANGQQQ